MDKHLQSAIAKYGPNPPRFLWKHLSVAEQRRLVIESVRKELRWLGLDTRKITDLLKEVKDAQP